MNMTLLGYSFASGVTLIILTAVYWLLLRNTTHFVLNRICVLSILTVSLIAPFVTLPQLSSIKVIPVEVGELTLSAMTSEVAVSQQNIDILKIIGSIYLIGVAIMTLRYLANLVFIIYLRSISRKKVWGILTLRVHKRKNIPPMSWGGEIFIEESLLCGESDELEMILAHENVHRSQRHWLDLTLSNIVLAVNWYNPAAWIIHHELIAVHEYEADSIASDISGDKIKYQLLLIKKTAGNRYQAIADSLNHSSLKKRIKMMMKNPTKSRARLRALAIVPATAIALCLTNSSCVKSACDKADAEDAAEPTAPQTEQVVSAAEEVSSTDETIVTNAPAKLPVFEGGIEKLYQMLAEKIQYPEDAINAGVQGKVLVELTVGRDGEISNTKILSGINESLDKEALAAIQRVKEAGGKFTPGYDAEGNPIVTTFALPISFKLQ